MQKRLISIKEFKTLFITPSNPPFVQTRFSAGETIIQKEQMGEFVYYLVEGVAESFSKTSTGIRYIHYQSKPGNFIGEIETMLNIPFSCTVIAVTECNVVIIPKAIFRITVFDSPTFASRFICFLCENLIHSSIKLPMDMKSSLKQRLMRFFLQKYQQFGNPFYVDKKLAADLFGCHLRSINRVVKELEAKSLLEYEKGQFRIPNEDKFKDALDHQD